MPSLFVDEPVDQYLTETEGDAEAGRSIRLLPCRVLMHTSPWQLMTTTTWIRCISDMSEAEFAKFHGGVKRGDFVAVVGFPGKSKRGELSMFPKSFRVASHCLHMMPYVLKDQETTYRQRYLDLMLNSEVRYIFETHAMIIYYVRRFLVNLNFLEVETPMMNMNVGGAVARPFETYHNDLNMRLNMLISPDLYLKQLLVGGLYRVFEIGKQFRN